MKIEFNPASRTRSSSTLRGVSGRPARGNFPGRNQRDGRRLERLRQALHRRENSRRQPADVAIGSSSRWNLKSPPRPVNRFSPGFEPFQMPDALAHKSFDLTAPKHLRAERCRAATDILRAEHSVADGQNVYRWEADDVQSAARRRPVAAGSGLTPRGSVISSATPTIITGTQPGDARPFAQPRLRRWRGN